jgi:hypothetical protein
MILLYVQSDQQPHEVEEAEQPRPYNRNGRRVSLAVGKTGTVSRREPYLQLFHTVLGK